MALYDLNKVVETSEFLVQKHYPNAVCAILTGSQTEEDFVSVVSDIDILIIDIELSGVSSEGIVYKNINIDFTRVGLWNLLDVLVDSCYSKNNTIMNMIIMGHFINDTLFIEESLRNYCQTLYRNSNVNYFLEYQNIRRSLVMLKKHFSKELKEEQIPLTLSDFLLKISKAYLFFEYNGKTGLNGYRRSKLLYKTSKDISFLKNINEFAKEYYLTQNNEKVIHQIDRFLEYSLLNSKKLQDFRYVLNIDLPRLNSYIFFTEILRLIKEENFLKTCFLYGKRVMKNSVFKHEYILVFENENGILDANILKHFNFVLKKSKFSKGLKFKSIDAFYIRELWFDLNCYYSFESIFKSINDVVMLIFKYDRKYNYNKMVPVFIYIILKCKQSWNLSSLDIIQALNILRNKYRPSIYYQNVDNENISPNNRIIKELDILFIKDNSSIIQQYKQLINGNIFLQEVKEEYPLFIELNESIDSSKKINLETSSTPPFIQNIFNSENRNLLYFLVLFFDFSLKSMGLNANQYAPVIVITLSVLEDEN